MRDKVKRERERQGVIESWAVAAGASQPRGLMCKALSILLEARLYEAHELSFSYPLAPPIRLSTVIFSRFNVIYL